MGTDTNGAPTEADHLKSQIDGLSGALAQSQAVREEQVRMMGAMSGEISALRAELNARRQAMAGAPPSPDAPRARKPIPGDEDYPGAAV